MTEAELNARAAADPYWFLQFALGCMATCLKSYEDILRHEHAERFDLSRAHADNRVYAYGNPRFFDGRDFMGNDPLFVAGGPPRHFGAVGDIRTRNRLFAELAGATRTAYGRSSAYGKLASLHRYMYLFGYIPEGTPWRKINKIYEHYERFASGDEDRAQMTGYAVAGSIVGRAGVLGPLRPRPPAGGGPAASRGISPEPVSLGRRTTPGPAPPHSESSRTTLPRICPAQEEIGYARTEPDLLQREPLGIRDTVEDLQYSTTIPEAPRTTSPPPATYEEMVRATAAELGGASGRGGRVIEVLTHQGAQTVGGQGTGSVRPSLRATYFPEGNFEAREAYKNVWRTLGGTGPPPEYGFVVRNSSGEIEHVALTSRPQRSPSTRLVPITAQQREIARRDHTPGSNHFIGRNGYEIYVAEWRTLGGDGPPPEFGFSIRQPDGQVTRTVGYWVEGPRRQ